MPTKPLTKKQLAVWSFIKEYRSKNGYSPTFTEITKRFKLNSPGQVHSHVTKMVKAGWMRRDPKLTQRDLIPLENFTKPKSKGIT